MTIVVVQPGAQTCVQAGPRTSLRHFGVPWAGAADCLSLALANRLVGNPLLAPALEAVLTGPTLAFECATQIGLAGANAPASLNGEALENHCTLNVKAGDTLRIGAIHEGARIYIAIAGGLIADEVLGSVSTYLPARLGGLDGRAIATGDCLMTGTRPPTGKEIVTPIEYPPPLLSSWALRASPAAETQLLTTQQLQRVYASQWKVGSRADRMGLELQGQRVELDAASMASAAVFPGTLQCPPSGVPFLLGVDAQTTGGYPRLLQVARVDRHLIGQLRPGDTLRFLPREPAQVAAELRAKHDYWREWLPGIELVI
jgi:allophanate hydrolase